MLIAHAGHWLVQLAYLAPVAGFLIWLALTTLRERRGQRDRPEEDGGPD